VKKHIKNYGVLLVVVFSIVSFSCKKKAEKDPNADIQGHYFSITQFALDEWNTFSGEPFTLLKTVKTGNKTDSSYTNTDSLDWTPIFKTFFESDISDRKYLGQYTFTQFDDNQDATHNFFYEANDKDIFTQKLLIAIDEYTNKVKGIYIETYKKTFGNEITQKLYYKPLKTIQIQTDERPTLGSKKYTIVQYEFLR
jgi:hypothetical protein